MKDKQFFLDNSSLGEGAPEVLDITDRKDQLRVELTGAKISLRLDGKQILSGFNSKRYDGKPAVSHPCTPNFGPYGSEFGLPQHGVGRTKTWNLVDYQPGRKASTSLNVDTGTYPKDLFVLRTYELKDGTLTISTIHKNKGNIPMPVVFGEHFYWSTNYSGWQNVLFNGQRIKDYIKSTGTMPIEPKNTISIPGHVDIVLEQSGFRGAVLWAMTQGDPESFDKHYFCLEPVQFDPIDFGQGKTLIDPGQETNCSVKIGLINHS